MDVLRRIKGLVARGRYKFSVKAADELASDEIEEAEVLESILNAMAIKKTIRSSHPGTKAPEKLYVIESISDAGTLIYSKGKITREEGEEIYYFFISAKLSRPSD